MNEDEFNALLKKADQGDAEVQVEVGLKYSTGEEIEVDYALAFSYFKKAADQENAGGLFGVGMCYWNGEGVEVDVWKAKEYLQKSVEKGHRGAAKYLDEVNIFLLKESLEKTKKAGDELSASIKEAICEAQEMKKLLDDIQKVLDKKS